MSRSFLTILFTVGAFLYVDCSLSRADEGFLGVEPDSDDPAFAYFTKITNEMTAGQPEWDPATEPLPKSTQELSKIALSSFTPAKSQVKSGWKVTGIWLRQVPVSLSGKDGDPKERRNRWYCQVSLAAHGDYKGEWWKNSANVYMFLDGTIIKPERRKAPSSSQAPIQ